MRQAICLSIAAGCWLLVPAFPSPTTAAGIEAGLEVAGCFAPLNQDSACHLRAFWTGASGRLQEVTILEAVKHDAAPERKDYRPTLRAHAGELAAPPPDGIRRTRKAAEFGSWLFEAKKPWTYCVKVRVRDDAGGQAESPPTCLNGN
jgi:hypothetical protein